MLVALAFTTTAYSSISNPKDPTNQIVQSLSSLADEWGNSERRTVEIID